MVIFNHYLLHLVALHVAPVYLGALVLALAQRADVEVVVQYALHGDDAPCAFDAAAVVLAFGDLALALGHARRGYALVGEGVCYLLVAPAVDVEPVDAADDLGLDGHDLELLLLVHDIAVGRGADPPAVLLTAADDALDLLARVRDGHLIYEELELDLEPVVVVREVDAVADGDYAHARVAQVLKLDQAAAVAAREAGEVFDDEDVQPVRHELPPHCLISLTLLEGVARAVAVLVEYELRARELVLDEVGDDGLLVLDGRVVAVKLLINGDAAITGDTERVVIIHAYHH